MVMHKLDNTIANILLVEDNPGDILLTKKAFKNANIKNEINVAEDGEQALDYLYKRNGYESATEPDLILLDLNMPRKDGREFLSDIKQDNQLRRIPVVVMTSSKAGRDVLEVYDLHANSYIVKPADLSSFSAIVAAIESFWFSVAVLPKSAGVK